MPNRTIYSLLLIGFVLLVDQGLKIWIKLNLNLGESFDLFGFDWFQIYFIENKGMAFGMELGITYGKLILSLFRIVAVTGIGFALFRLVSNKASYLVLTSIALIFAGALGNIIDSAFYGLYFSHSSGLQTASITSFGEGYASFLQGNVVDMFYFPLIDTVFPKWVPYLGGTPFKFFQAIFNIADAAICIGIGIIFLFNKKFFAPTQASEENKAAETTNRQFAQELN